MMVICPYCSHPAKSATGADIYPHLPEIAHKQFYRCQPCNAWVGCHDGTDKPLGRLADAELRMAKRQCHALFDPLWKRRMVISDCKKQVARGLGYAWLARELGIDAKDCHIGMFDLPTCRRVIAICAPYARPS